tara:strand:- start:7459 stop:9558 length:2100 start_codon:yes stop_codon:yes gene_type:complete
MQTVGVDVGGTFTDISVVDEDGKLSILKVLSTPNDFSEAICSGIEQEIQTGNLAQNQVSSVVHAATVATNAIITRTGSKVGLITTEGFRDILEIGRLRYPRLYDMEWEKPAPLVPRYLRQEVKERVDYAGNVVTPVDKGSIAIAAQSLVDFGVDSIAIVLINSYANPVHEEIIQDYIAREFPAINISASYKVLPEVKEYERTSTTVINAYVKPAIEHYLTNLEGKLKSIGIEAPIMVMQSSGGTVQSKTAKEHAVHSIESGPAAGVVGAAMFGKQLGISNLISFDMGGTTAKTCLIEDGEPRHTSEYEVGGGISIGHRLLKGGGYLLRVPAIDLAEIGAGGGSIAWIDRGGAMRVGPHSAGADPGPACYLRGGTEPTVTDANVVLGYLNSKYLVGGELPIDGDLAMSVLKKKIAEPLNLSIEDAAFGIHTIVNANMVRAVRAVSTEIGRDPRDFTLFAFGGSGPVHAGSLADEAKIAQVIIPPAPGVFSSLGLLFTTVEHQYVQTFWRDTDTAELSELARIFQRIQDEASETLSSEGFKPEEMEFQRFVDLRYPGQTSELSIPVPSGVIDKQVVTNLVEEFNKEHEKSYGFRSEEEEIVEFVNLRLRGRGLADNNFTPSKFVTGASKGKTKQDDSQADRRVYFGSKIGWITSPVLQRGHLSQENISGPLVIEEYDTTVVVGPNMHVRTDDANNIRLTLV